MTLRNKIIIGSVLAAGIAGITYAAGFVQEQALLGIVTAVNGLLAAAMAYVQSRPTD
jgi:hypothetical protein